ncbi:CPBP family intramembrane glutamic endopeptidase [Loigolactobacillus zhaoyuanensis]|uniref:CPBP family intramembrane glutamic endopeptidase n=2 Tax=Loigolactobacillus zhaoyuanensis TaxID=2486017 RepID=UPI000F74890C
MTIINANHSGWATTRHIIYFCLLILAEQLPLTGLSLASSLVGTQITTVLGSLFLLISILMTILFWQVYRKAVVDNHFEFERRLHKRDWLLIGGGLIAMWVINAVTLPFVKTSGNSNVDSLTSLLTSFTFFMLFFVAFIGPILEEILFRGLFLNWFFTKHRLVSILLSAVLFGTFHVDLTSGHVDPIYWLSKVLLGLVLALVYSRTKNLKASILLHILNNTLAAFI